MRDGGDEILDAVEHTAANPFRRDFAKPAFDEIQPRRAGRREVQVKARMRGQPALTFGMRVGAVVVEDQMESRFRGNSRRAAAGTVRNSWCDGAGDIAR